MLGIILSLWFLLGNSNADGGTNRDKLNISVIAAMQPSAPLQVSGISMPSGGKAYGAVVHNSGNKKAVGYEIQWSAAAPPGCAHVSNPHVFRYSRTVKSELKPDETQSKDASEVKVSDLRDVAEKLKTHYLQVQVGVVKVYLEQGATWQEDLRNDDTDIFMPSVLNADADKCRSD